MPTMKGREKKAEKAEKLYSYDEFRKTFYPNSDSEQATLPQDPKVFGRKLGEEAVKRIREQTQSK